ncbi:uncharacterized protein LOC110886754 [Helianthus annuus]|uniref:uncharacterized protein LOC110886754 n=1 Tax=Helianthus annuus TaxID=4232 RepID=UPI000B8F20D1|nr:uncharacterized protein LOC110886754 [Helianthus annuus]
MGAGKASLVRSLIKENNVGFLALQETQLCNMSEEKIRKFWNGSAMEYVKKDAVGRSGGILSIWNPGDLIGEGLEITVVNVYAPNIGTERRRLWDRLLYVMNNIHGLCLLIGDFNEVRVPEDTLNSNFDCCNALHFNNFISTAGLLEYPMSGRRYTFLSGDGKKMSKIDRALVSSEFMSKWPNASLRALERLDISGLDEVVRTGLEYQTVGNFKDLILSSKLKAIKDEVKKWRKTTREAEEKDFAKATNHIKVFDAAAEERAGGK